MKAIVAEAMDAGAVGFATSVSKVHIGYSGRPVPSRLAEFGEMLEIADAVGKSGHGIIHYNVGRDPRWDEYEQLHAEERPPGHLDGAAGGVAGAQLAPRRSSRNRAS